MGDAADMTNPADQTGSTRYWDPAEYDTAFDEVPLDRYALARWQAAVGLAALVEAFPGTWRDELAELMADVDEDGGHE